MSPLQTKSWCVEWFGSQGEFIAGRAKEPVSLERFGGFENLYAVGPLEQARGEISIYDSVPLIAEVRDGRVAVTVDSFRRAGFLVYAIVDQWRRATVHEPIYNEPQLEEQLLALAAESGIDVEQPFPFVVQGRVTATFHVLCNQSEEPYSPERHEKAKVRFSIAEEAVEIIGFYSRRHRGVFTPRDSNFHMHVRTLDNRLSGHVEAFALPQGMTVDLPANAT